MKFEYILFAILIIGFIFLYFKLLEVEERSERNLHFVEKVMNISEKIVDALSEVSYLAYNNSYKIYIIENRQNEIYDKIDILNESLVKYPIKKKVGYDRLMRFLAEDETDKIEYKFPEFVCVDYASALISRLAEEGYFSCMANFYLNCNGEEVGHAGVAAYTDLGLMYVEPMDDIVIPYYSFDVGDDYCKVVGWDCNCVIEKKVSCFDY